jgi:hypothetical protein
MAAPCVVMFSGAGNVLIRHLTGDPPEMAARATAALSSGEQLLLADLEATGVDEILSFDRSIDRVAGIRRREP